MDERSVDLERAERIVEDALLRNKARADQPAAERIAASIGSAGIEEVLVLVAVEPEGFVYGHLFQEVDTGRWCSLLVFSTADVMRDRQAEPVATFRSQVVEALDFEPVLSFRPGDASAWSEDLPSGLDALATMIVFYTGDAIGLPGGASRAGSLDWAVFHAYDASSAIR